TEPPRARLGRGGESLDGGEGLGQRRATHRERARDRREVRHPDDGLASPCNAVRPLSMREGRDRGRPSPRPRRSRRPRAGGLIRAGGAGAPGIPVVSGGSPDLPRTSDISIVTSLPLSPMLLIAHPTKPGSTLIAWPSRKPEDEAPRRSSA